MDMPLRHVSIQTLADILNAHSSNSPVPYLLDSKAISRARRLAKQNGLWNRITETLDPTQPIPVIPRSEYREYRRSGSRVEGERCLQRRHREFTLASMALWLDHPKANLDYLQDLIWAYCEETNWVMPAHEERPLDLRSTTLAAELAECVHVLGDRLEEEICQRITREVHKRLFDFYYNTNNTVFWRTYHNNWNHVCNGALIRAAMYLIPNNYQLAFMIHEPINNLVYALDAFTDDGGCEEGPGYWSYGFGHYVMAAHGLFCRTGGKLNIMDDPKIERICRYPLAAYLQSPQRAVFGDASHGPLMCQWALLIYDFYKIPELFSLCRMENGKPTLHTMTELTLYTGQTSKPAESDALLPGLGLAKLTGKPGSRQLTLSAMAGNNGVSHNHNDIGSFIVHRGDTCWLTDPGGPIYSANTFNKHRYESIFCNSLGHSVPVINAVQQGTGSEYHGEITADNLNGDGEKHVTIDMTRAYPKGTVQSLRRTFTLDAPANTLRLCDTYAFSRTPKSILEVFMTYEQAKVAPGGRSVQVGPKSKGVCLSASKDTPGRFSIEQLVKESREAHGNQLLTRITFTPKTLQKDMQLSFEIK